MQVSSATVIGFLVGLATGIVSIGQVVALSPQVVALIHQDAWWIVVLSMLVPLADYLTGVRTTLLGVVAKHPFRHWAGFFAGLSVGLGLFLLFSPGLVSSLPSQLQWSNMNVPQFTDLELFLLSGWVAYILVRLLADSVKLRLYIDFKDWKVKVGKPLASGRIQKLSAKMFGGKGSAPSTHVHHFVFGMFLMPLTFVALYWRLWYGPVLVGVVMALIFSEVKELMFMSWGQ